MGRTQGNFVLSGIRFYNGLLGRFPVTACSNEESSGYEEHEGDTKATKRNEKAAVPVALTKDRARTGCVASGDAFSGRPELVARSICFRI